jgi:hypothetical protein
MNTRKYLKFFLYFSVGTWLRAFIFVFKDDYTNLV